MKTQLKIAFLHLDLGIGGAERLVVDAASALKQHEGFQVKIYTAHHDPNRCFPETNESLDVEVIGGFIPRSILGHLIALMAYIRMIYIALYLVYCCPQSYDLFICDQVSACIPFLHIAKKKVIFYCHFPDQLLTKRSNLLKELYRKPLDWFEEYTTGKADTILVNSEFTARIFRTTFRSLNGIPLHTLYPSVNCELFLNYKPVNNPTGGEPVTNRKDGRFTFLSVNRYERKKNLALAIQALSRLYDDSMNLPNSIDIHLNMAGGYDERIAENREYFEELVQLAFDSSIRPRVTFFKSPSDQKKLDLYHSCDAVIYTPENEHFGIVPLEAMLMQKPVIACNSGGPLETIVHDRTGFLCQPNPESFSTKMFELCSDLTKSKSKQMGRTAREHVIKNFSFKAFQTQLVRVCLQTAH